MAGGEIETTQHQVSIRLRSVPGQPASRRAASVSPVRSRTCARPACASATWGRRPRPPGKGARPREAGRERGNPWLGAASFWRGRAARVRPGARVHSSSICAAWRKAWHRSCGRCVPAGRLWPQRSGARSGRSAASAWASLSLGRSCRHWVSSLSALGGVCRGA